MCKIVINILSLVACDVIVSPNEKIYSCQTVVIISFDIILIACLVTILLATLSKLWWIAMSNVTISKHRMRWKVVSLVHSRQVRGKERCGPYDSWDWYWCFVQEEKAYFLTNNACFYPAIQWIWLIGTIHVRDSVQETYNEKNKSHYLFFHGCNITPQGS